MIIGLLGYKNSGKSTVAEHLARQFNYDRLGFAEPLKKMLESLGIPKQFTRGIWKEEPNSILCGRTARWAMQTLGTEWGRELIGEDLWINVWKLHLNSPNTVVEDVRFKNEVEAVRSKGGKLWFINRPIAQQTDKHISEHIDPHWADDEIINNGSIDMLQKRVDDLFSKLNHAR